VTTLPKTTDITGTFRVPQEAWGSFWNFMLTLDGADITPNTRVSAAKPAPRKKGSDAGGTSLRCIMLAGLANITSLPTSELAELIEAAGKAKSSVSNAIFEAKRDGLIKPVKGTRAVYAITPAGKKYLETECKLK
jgi:hypothetical protein